MGAVDIVSGIGTGVAVLLIASQVPVMLEVWRGKRAMNDSSPWPTLGQAANFFAWCVYGLEQGDPNVLRVNVIGAAFSLGYAAMFARYSSGAARRTFWQLVGGFVVIQGLFFGGALGIPGLSTETRVTILGYWAVGANVCMYAFPLDALRLALKSMDPGAIPLLLTSAGMACSATWLTYGLLVSNWFVAGPNFAGVGLNFIQLCIAAYINLYAVKGKRTRLGSASEGATDEEYARLPTATDLN